MVCRIGSGVVVSSSLYAPVFVKYVEIYITFVYGLCEVNFLHTMFTFVLTNVLWRVQHRKDYIIYAHSEYTYPCVAFKSRGDLLKSLLNCHNHKRDKIFAPLYSPQQNL